MLTPPFERKVNEPFNPENASNLTHELFMIILMKKIFCFHKKTHVSNLTHYLTRNGLFTFPLKRGAQKPKF